MAARDELHKIVEKYWGFRSFRPLQEEAMEAELARRDSLVVMPTGAGKSLCFQAPAVLRPGTTIVVSPLIALMKDQVDGLQSCGIAATQIDSTLTSSEKSGTEFDLLQGNIKLLFVSPERLAMPEFVNLLRRAKVNTFAIDEAHCISHWGHDFRPEYRQLNKIKELFPGAAIHAYTATATEQVRNDICKQLNQSNPLVLVGNFDRANLTYRVLGKRDLFPQILSVLKRHKGEAGIIYCLRRTDVEEINTFLQGEGYKSLGYHAGLDKNERTRTQEEYIEERCDIIVATVAFGMGIDRSNIRFVLHTGIPKSIEHYQQETGRAGRDGLEAECVLLYSAGDTITWKRIMEKSAQESGADTSFLAAAYKHLDDMDRYARAGVCRHRALVGYFGQKYPSPNCGACDLCLGDNEPVAEGVVLAQKILSCVARVQERWGITHVIGVLRGENTEKIRSMKHDQLTTYGLLKEHSKNDLREWIYQLIGQEVLVQAGDEYPILKLNDASWEVMRKQRPVRLMQATGRSAKEKPEKSKAEATSWEGVDRDLFEELRSLRLKLATERGVPPYIVFSDATLRELARVRPSTREKLRLIYGIGERKLADLGDIVLKAIASWCEDKGLAMDQRMSEPAAPPPRSTPTGNSSTSASKSLAMILFTKGASVDDVIQRTARAKSTVMEYLAEYIQQAKPVSIEEWVHPAIYKQIAAAIKRSGTMRLKPVFVELGEQVPYDVIRLVAAHLAPSETES